MRTSAFALGLIVACAVAVGAQNERAVGTTGSAITASATLVDAENRAVGQARFEETPLGVIVRLDLMNATPGTHALHIHETGRCDAPSFESAGGHFNPEGREHGFKTPDGPHSGDLPNIHVPASLELTAEFFLWDVRISEGPSALLDDDGAAILMHSGEDDYLTEPAGDAGTRIACGPIVSQADTREPVSVR